jgi:hypothetical protein
MTSVPQKPYFPPAHHGALVKYMLDRTQQPERTRYEPAWEVLREFVNELSPAQFKEMLGGMSDTEIVDMLAPRPPGKDPIYGKDSVISWLADMKHNGQWHNMEKLDMLIERMGTNPQAMAALFTFPVLKRLTYTIEEAQDRKPKMVEPAHALFKRIVTVMKDMPELVDALAIRTLSVHPGHHGGLPDSLEGPLYDLIQMSIYRREPDAGLLRTIIETLPDASARRLLDTKLTVYGLHTAAPPDCLTFTPNVAMEIDRGVHGKKTETFARLEYSPSSLAYKYAPLKAIIDEAVKVREPGQGWNLS